MLNWLEIVLSRNCKNGVSRCTDGYFENSLSRKYEIRLKLDGVIAEVLYHIFHKISCLVTLK